MAEENNHEAAGGAADDDDIDQEDIRNLHIDGNMNLQSPTNLLINFSNCNCIPFFIDDERFADAEEN